MNDSDLLQQYEALIDDAGVAELAGRTHVELTGGDRASFFHGQCTNDIKRLAPGEGCEAFLTNLQGKTVGHVYVTCGADRLTLESAPGQGEAIVRQLDRYLIREDVQLHDRSGEWRQLLLAGARAEKLLGDLLGVLPPTSVGSHVDQDLFGARVSVRRTDYVWPPAYFLTTSADAASQLRDELERRGARGCSEQVVESLRIESGTPLYGRDVTVDNLPQELARDSRAISFTKGCYLGQETVARLDALGHVNRTLVGLKFESATPPEVGAELRSGDKPAGRVTSVAYSPGLRTAVALAFVRRGANAVGASLVAPTGRATVVATPMRRES